MMTMTCLFLGATALLSSSYSTSVHALVATPPHMGLFGAVKTRLAAPRTKLLFWRRPAVATTVTKRTGTSFLPEDAVERATAGNKIEKTKLEKDATMAWTDLYDYAAKIRAGELDWETVEAGDANIRLKWTGMLSRFKKTPGRFMLRLRTPNGITSSDAMRLFADSIEPYGPDVGVADITTRQNWQLRGLTLEDGAALIERLHTVNVTSYQSAMDNVRNLVGSPLAGLGDENELIDTRPYCQALNDLITMDPETKTRGNPTWGNLPRKFNIAVSGGPADYAHSKINDLAFEATKHSKTGELGFNVVVGGYFSSKRSTLAIDLDLWVPASIENVLDLSTAVLRVFRDEGARGDRQKARLMWLVEKYGVSQFKARVLEELKLVSPKRWESSLITGGVPFYDARQEEDSSVLVVERDNLLGVAPCASSSSYRVGVHVPTGRLSVAELRLLATLADEHSNGELRLTVEQNVLFPEVNDPEALSRDVYEGSMGRLSTTPGPVSGNTVSCTGAQFCPLAIIETKQLAERISVKLDAQLAAPIRLHVTGCPNSCGQVQLADIGLMGAPARRVDPETGKAKAVPGCNVFVGGTVGPDSTLSLEPILKGVPIDDEDELVQVLVGVAHEHFPATVTVPSATLSDQQQVSHSATSTDEASDDGFFPGRPRAKTLLGSIVASK